jgi:hypothetical protein
MEDSVRRLLDEQLPEPPPGFAQPPLAAIRRGARRRTGVQAVAAVAAVAVIAVGAVVVLSDGDGAANTPAVGGTSTAASATGGPADTKAMLVPTYVPPGYVKDGDGRPGSGPEVALRYIDPAGTPSIPLVVRRLPETAGIPAEWSAIQQATTRGRTAEVFMTENGGMTVTWLEDGSRYSVGFEAPPNVQVDYAVEQTVDVLVGVADGLRAGR